MSFTYPLATADFWEATFIGPAVFHLPTTMRKTGSTRGGKVLMKIDGAAKWIGSATFAPHNNRDSISMEARLRKIRAGGTFLAYDLRAPYPAADPDGSKLGNGSVVALGGEAAYGDVSLGAYRYEGNVVTLAQAASMVGDAGTYFDMDGVLQTSASNVLRVDYGPFPNYVLNPKAAGAIAGSPGTAPTNWTITTGGGVTRTIVGTGVENGIPYIDVRLQAASAIDAYISPVAAANIVRAVTGQAWTNSYWVKLVSGSMSNLTLTINVNEYNAAGSYLAASNPAVVPTAALARVQASRVLNQATTAFVQGYLALLATGAYDVTLRIGYPMLERAATASAYPRLPIGILAETAFTQRLIRNRDFSNAAWSRVRTGTPTLASVLDPWGGTAAYKVPEDSTAANTHFIYQAYTTTNYVNHVAFCFAKAAERTKIQMQLSNFTTTNCSAIFDLVAGTVSSVISGTGDFTGCSARMVDLGNGWFWCELEALKVTGDIDCNALVLLCDAAGSNTYNGDGTSGVYLAFGGLEEGVTGHMPVVTTSVAVARAADALTIKAKGTNDWTVTFDNDATQAFSDDAGDFTPSAASLTRAWVKKWNAIRDTQPAAAAPEVESIGADNTSAALRKLPPFFKITMGDYISFPRSNGKRMLVQALEDAVANHLGVTAEFQVEPPFRSGSLAGALVTLIKAPAEFMLPDGWTAPTGNGPISDGMNFMFEENL